MKIINIRSTNGAGKTWTARQVMRHFQADFEGERLTVGGVKYQDFGRFAVVGSYDRVCGGADTIDYKENTTVIKDLIALGKHVLTEGVMFGNVFQPWIDLLAELPAHTYIPVCLSTPLETCIENVTSRRAAENKSPIDDPKNIVTNYNKHVSSAKKFHALGLNPHWVSSEEAVQLIVKELSNA